MRDLYNKRDPPVIGSLAGGRKTTSAALQSAFCLHGRREELETLVVKRHLKDRCVIRDARAVLTMRASPSKPPGRRRSGGPAAGGALT